MKTIAFMLILTMVCSGVLGGRFVVYAEVLEISEIASDSHSPEAFASIITMLSYEGERRIVNNLIYEYTDGMLASITDARGNTVLFVYNEIGELAEIHTDRYIMQVGVNEFGYLTHYHIVGTAIGASYYYDENGVLVGITRNDTTMRISYDEHFDSQLVSLNGDLIIDNSLSSEVSFTSFANQSRANTLFTDLILFAEYSLDEYYRVTHINYSNDVTVSAEYGLFGLSNTTVNFRNSRGQSHTLSTSITPEVVPVGELLRMDEVIFSQHNNDFRYVANDMGLIESVFRNDILVQEFLYDDITGQLIKEIDHTLGSIRTFAFDSFGNMLYSTLTEYDGTIQTHTFEYNNPMWRDQLTGFNGSQILYDASGNMIYGLGMDLEWSDNNVVRLQKDGNIITFTYDSFGFMESKTTNGVTTYFLMDGGRVIAERSTSGQTIVYMFDHQYNLIGFELNGVPFFYMSNLQGDVVGILNENMEVIVEYRYDAWGNILEIIGPEADTIGRINPIRYRGYRFDEISGLYIIGSRLYSPVLMRMINPDNNLGIIGNSISHNLYAYALNNPVSVSIDPFSFTLTKTFIFGIVAIVLIWFLLASWYTMPMMTSFHSSFMAAINNLARTINDNIFAARSWGEQLMAQVRTANEVYRNARTPLQQHHIVAQTAQAAAMSRHIFLPHYNNNIHHWINMIPVRNSLHRRMHTDLYHTTVGNILALANGGSAQFNQNRFGTINSAMNLLRQTIQIASDMSP